MGSSIFPDTTRNPYYIITNRYARTSAGIKALHLLCHSLNALGERAFLIIDPFHPPQLSTHPDLLTPLLTSRIMESHFERGLTPITIYPETIPGNPYQAPFVVRYFLNYPGLLGGENSFDPSEFSISYSETLGRSIENNKLVLFIPTSDPSLFTPKPSVKRMGTCFYATKYLDVHNGNLLAVTKNSVQITRDRTDSPTPKQIAELFRKSELFYCYENSALVIEAILCGCPAVFLPNPYLTESIGANEIGWDGIAWGTDPEEIERAKQTVMKARENYLALFDIFWERLATFVEMTQEEVKTVPYGKQMAIPEDLSVTYGLLTQIKAAVSLFRYTARNSGLAYAFRRSFRRILRKGIKIDLDRIGK